MRTTYRVLAWAIAAGVAIQAAAIAYAIFGLGAYIEGGGTLDAASQESASFPGVVGFAVHGIGGEMVIPLLALVLLAVSFFAHVPRGVEWAGIVVGAVVVQVALGLFAHGLPALGALHGLGALGLFAAAVVAARLAGTPDAAVPAAASAPVEHPTQPA